MPMPIWGSASRTNSIRVRLELGWERIGRSVGRAAADARLGLSAVPEHAAWQHVRSIDLDVDIGADAVDYNAIAKQESLSGLEVEMRKLEGVVKEM